MQQCKKRSVKHEMNKAIIENDWGSWRMLMPENGIARFLSWPVNPYLRTSGLIFGFEIRKEPFLVGSADGSIGEGADNQDKLGLEKGIQVLFQGVVHPDAATSVIQPAVFLQIGKMTRDRRLRQVEGIHQITDAELNPSLQEQDQTQSGFIGQGFEYIGGCFHDLFLIHQKIAVNRNNMKKRIIWIYPPIEI